MPMCLGSSEAKSGENMSAKSEYSAETFVGASSAIKPDIWGFLKRWTSSEEELGNASELIDPTWTT